MTFSRVDSNCVESNVFSFGLTEEATVYIADGIFMRFTELDTNIMSSLEPCLL